MEMPDEIDIVLPWVDGNDPVWRLRFDCFSDLEKGDKRNIRFRDWGLLQYWFRGVEKFAPWIRKIHFITSGELPEWINLESPKLNWVKHEDYIPQEFLPTFSSNVIEIFMHRIKDLSEHFIYFNDDVFLTAPTKPADYFYKQLPTDFAILDPIVPRDVYGSYVNGIHVVDRYFSKRKVVEQHFSKWINLKYGKYLLKSMLLLPWRHFPGLLVAHISQPYRKTTFEEVWDVEQLLLLETAKSRFRSQADVNQWLFRFWHLAKGDFSPKNTLKRGRYVSMDSTTIDAICGWIQGGEWQEICLNDVTEDVDFERYKQMLHEAFEHILPEKSNFEK
ncbi:MAG: hypothetical protein BGN96_11025 [Bacteroidales bacterium 45-6]|nr:MAG: hypothetical protein BGN96_11025 [Bacteroidales bacterium 45-6]